MATQRAHKTARLMVSPSVILLLAWMIIPLGTTIYFSFLRYNILTPPATWTGFENYYYFLTDPAFIPALINTMVLVLGVLFITTVGGILLALLLNLEFWGQGIVRILVISPFFVMPTVSALVWKNMFMDPVNGLFAHLFRALGLQPIEFLSTIPLLSIIIMVAWAWLPFATLILLTALQSLDSEQMEAAEMDGANSFSRFIYLTLPHLTRSITVVVLIQTIFLLAVFAEIYVTTAGGPGYASTNIPFMIYNVSLKQFDAGMGAAGGIIAVILANIVAFFLMRAVGKNLEL